MKLVNTLREDFHRIDKPSLLRFIKWYFFPQGSMIRYIFWFRLMQKIKENKISKAILGLPIYFIYRHYEFKYGIHINTNTQVGSGLCIVHGDGVYLNCKQIGRNFTCYQGVTLGTNAGGGIPTVGDNVTVYAGSIIVGSINLDDGCMIGANSFVNRSVRSQIKVAGNPAREIL